MRRLLWVSLTITIAVLGVAACADDPLESCSSSPTCGKDVRTCCTATQCHYELNGRNYNCDGTSCSAAAQQVVNAACANVPGGVAASGDASELVGAAQSLAAGVCPSLP